MSLPANRQSILDALLADTITWSEASKSLQSLPPSWQSAEWKALRNEIIKGSCEKCGSTEGPMVIQHSRHPESINDIIYRLAASNNMRLDDWVAKEKDHLAARYAQIKPEPVPVCPRCESTAIRWHKTSQQWKCKGTAGLSWQQRQRGGCCGNTFTTPMEINGLTPAMKKIQADLNREAYNQAKSNWWDAVCSRFGKEAVLENLRQSKIYASLVDTRTLCKRCAFAEDKVLIGR